jgi:hypothetical protein
MSKHSVVTNSDTITYKDEEIMSVTVTVVCEDGTTVEHKDVDTVGDSSKKAVRDRLKTNCLSRVDDHYDGTIFTDD